MEDLFAHLRRQEPGGGGGGMPPNFDLSKLMSLANTPQAANVMQSLGIDPTMATQLLSQLSNPQANNDDKNDAADDDADSLALCDACDLPINVGEVRWTCTTCPDFDLHDACRAAANHDASHEWVTNYASEDHIVALRETGGAGRDFAIELLNGHRGNFEEALQMLLSVK